MSSSHESASVRGLGGYVHLLRHLPSHSIGIKTQEYVFFATFHPSPQVGLNWFLPSLPEMLTMKELLFIKGLREAC